MPQVGESLVGRRAYLKTGALAGGVILAGCLGGGGGGTTSLTAAGGSSDSTEFSGVQTYAVLVDEKSDSVSINAQTSAGTVENHRLIDQGEVDLGIGPVDTTYAALNNSGPFAEEGLETIPLAGFTMGLYESYLMALDGSGIETYEDLRGKTVWPFWPGSAARDFFEAGLGSEYLGVWNDMEVLSVGPGQISGLISEGRVDAFGVFTTSGNIGLYNEELDGRGNLEFHPVKMSDENFSMLEEIVSPSWIRREVTGWSRDFVGEEAPMTITANTLLFHPDISKDIGYELTKIAHENGERLANDAILFPDISDKEELVVGNIPEVPIQEGVADYYKEIDVWNEEWQTG